MFGGLGMVHEDSGAGLATTRVCRGGVLIGRGGAVRAEGRVLVEGCAAGLDGGGIYLVAPLALRPAAAAAAAAANPSAAARGGGRFELVRNTAGRTGGGARALGASAGITVAQGAGLAVMGNSAGLDGGGLALAGGAGLGAAAGRCPAAVCPASRRGDGACDPECMTTGCNWCIAPPHHRCPSRLTYDSTGGHRPPP